MATSIVSKARTTEHGTAKIPLMNNKNEVVNFVSTENDPSILFFLDDRRSKDYTDISGCKVRMVITADRGDKTVTKESVVEILRADATKIYVLYNDVAYGVNKSNVTLYAID